MEHKTIIQPAANGQWDAISALLKAEKLPVEDLPATLENFFVALDGSVVTGLAGIEVYESYGLLRSLAVDKNYRGRSIAAALVQAVEAKAAELQVTCVYLLTETAKGYFTKKDYAVIGRDAVPEAVKQSSQFSHVCPVSATVMHKQIPSLP